MSANQLPVAELASLLANTRTRVRHVVIEEGVRLIPETSGQISEAIGGLVAEIQPTLSATTSSLLDRVRNRELVFAIDEQNGMIITAYSDAGYFVGLCAGLELAEQVLGRTGTLERLAGPVPRRSVRRPARRAGKGGTR